MKNMYKLVQAIIFAVLLITQNNVFAQNCCLDCQSDVKGVSDKQVLLEKIDIKVGTSITNFSTNVYVSYRSGNAQKFWANVAIATAGVAVSTQLNSSPITAGDSKSQSGISPMIPLGVTVATLPGIWKNRPRGVPEAGLWIQHRNIKGELLETWEQPISNEAKNSAELLTIAVDKPLSEGTLEIYLQNGSKNEVYFWGLQTLKNVVDVVNKIAKEAPKKPSSARSGGCSIDVYQRGNSRAAGLGGSSANNNNTNSSDDLEAQGYTLLYSIPFDCGTGTTTSNQEGIQSGTNAYDAYQEFLRRADDYNSQTMGGSGGSGGAGNNQDPNYNPIATVDGPVEKQRCVDGVYKNYFHPKQEELNNRYNAEYRFIANAVLVTVLGSWLQSIFTDWDKDNLRDFFKETWKTLLIPPSLFTVSQEIDYKIKRIAEREKADNEELDRETIKKINDCLK